MISNSSNIQRSSQATWLGLFFAGLAVLIGASIHHDAIILVQMVVFVLFSLALLLIKVIKHLRGRSRDWIRLSAELLVPAVLWLLFGFGGLFSFFMPGVVTIFQTTYEMTTVLLMALYIGIGAICYVFGFRVGFRDTAPRAYGKKAISRRTFVALLTILLLVDWYVRVDQIRGGIYFTWLTAHAQTRQAAVRTTNTLYHFHSTFAPIILPLLVYAVIVCPKKGVYRVLLLVQSTSILLQGQRRDVLFAAFATLLPFFALKRLRISRRLLIGVLLGVTLFLGFIGPLIEEARLLMRYDASSLLIRPEQIIQRYVLEYIPQALSLDRILGSPDVSLRAQRNISLAERIGGYMSYAANIQQAMIDGRAGPNIEQFGTALSLIIPRFLYPNKPVVDANDMIYEHFDFGRLGYDATGSPVADVFGYLHLPGIVGLFSLVGVGYGFVASYLRRHYGQIGDMIMIGIVPSALPIGDAFGGYLANLRNVLLLVTLIAVFVNICSVFLGTHQRPNVCQGIGRSA